MSSNSVEALVNETPVDQGALDMRRHGGGPASVAVPAQAEPQLTVPTQGPGYAAEVAFINGLNADGTINASSYWGYEGGTAFKYGAPTAGTGATITYAVDPSSNFTTAEQHTFESALAMWASVANITFVAASSSTSADILLRRTSDEQAATHFFTSDGSGSTLGQHTAQTVIGIDTSIYGFELDGSFTESGGYGWGTIVHEIGHALGLGHGGQYDGEVDPATEQNSAFDDRMWTTMSYINWTDSNAKYRNAALAGSTDWGQFQATVDGHTFTDTRDAPYTVMELDILAIQQLYGAPTGSPMSGGQVYGFNTNITGPLKVFYDFTIDKAPIVTLFNTGTNNTLDVSGYGQGQAINLATGTFSSVGGLRNNLYIADGTHIDTAVGGAGDDRITANDSGDTLYGNGGNDTLTGGLGNDKLYGGTGDGSDTISGGAGKDHIEGHGTLNGDDGNDYILGSGSLYGGAGDDQLLGTTGSVLADGGDGNDVIVAGTLEGTSHGGAGDDVMIGGVTNDIFYGDAGIDTFRGGAGNDTFYVDSQSELVFENAGEGTDTIYSSASFYLYANIENLTLQEGAAFGVGNDLNNQIIGNTGDNTLLGGVGDDTITAAGGNDIVYGEAGNDAIDGGIGVDYLVGGDGNDLLQGFNGADAIYGGDGDDVLWGDIPKPYTDYGGASVITVKPAFDTDILVGGNGNDILHGEDSLGDYDRMDGGAGDDTYYVDTPNDLTFEAAGGGTDTVIAGIKGAGYYLYANVENLTLTDQTPFGVGNELNNKLVGNDIDNWLLGGAGNDILNGKAGNDILFGEAGSDTFVFEHGTGADIIGDFVAATDKIDLVAIGYTWAQVQNSFHQNGGDLAIDLGNGDLIILQGVNSSQLHQSDFVLAGGSSAGVEVEQAAQAHHTIDLHQGWNGSPDVLLAL